MTTITPSAVRIAGYICAFMAGFEPGSAAGRKLAGWLRANGAASGMDFRAATGSRGTAARPLSKAAWERLAQHAAATAQAGDPRGDGLARNLGEFALAIGLERLERAVLCLALDASWDAQFHSLCTDLVATRAIDTQGLLALAVGCPRAELVDRWRRGALGALNLAYVAGDEAACFACYVPYAIRRALLPPSDGLADIERHLIGRPMAARLEPGAFGHIARERDFLLRLLTGAVERRQKGVNILLYGPPGTGKSEFCKTLAAASGCDLFAVGEADEDGDELCRSGRIDALRLADRLARCRGKVWLMFDEMEDILQEGERSFGRQSIRRAGSKVFFNRLLEQNTVPVLWTANAIDEFDPAFLRRMSFVLEMKPLPQAARAQLWRGLACRRALDLSEPEAETLARRYAVAPSVMTTAAEAVALAGGCADEIDFVMRSLTRPLGVAARETAGPASYVPDLANADTDLAALTASLAKPGAPRDVSLCLYGPPGTGKSGYARHLAESIGLEPLLKRGSDLLSKWLGETEQRIAEAFAEALRDNRCLIIDEAEGFLWSRDGASRSWEVSMVNELLVAMETHPLPFACTTNHLDMLDAAALRRFSFKIKFDALTSAQTALAWRRFFERAAPLALSRIEDLTPGDFAVVAKRLRFLDEADRNDAAILRLLEQEAAIKRRGTGRIGF